MGEPIVIQKTKKPLGPLLFPLCNVFSSPDNILILSHIIASLVSLSQDIYLYIPHYDKTYNSRLDGEIN